MTQPFYGDSKYYGLKLGRTTPFYRVSLRRGMVEYRGGFPVVLFLFIFRILGCFTIWLVGGRERAQNTQEQTHKSRTQQGEHNTTEITRATDIRDPRKGYTIVCMHPTERVLTLCEGRLPGPLRGCDRDNPPGPVAGLRSRECQRPQSCT